MIDDKIRDTNRKTIASPRLMLAPTTTSNALRERRE
jgi:hypothetical protein